MTLSTASASLAWTRTACYFTACYSMSRQLAPGDWVEVLSRGQCRYHGKVVGDVDYTTESMTLTEVISFGTENRVRNDGLRIPEKLHGIPQFLIFDYSHVVHVHSVTGIPEDCPVVEVLAPALDAHPDTDTEEAEAEPSSYPDVTPSSTTGTPHRTPRTGSTKAMPIGATQYSANIHPEAAGRIIGAGGIGLRYIKQTKGIYKATFKRVDLNFHTLLVVGTEDAVAEVRKLVEFKIGLSTTQLHNKLRDHSWTLTPDGRMRTPREVHKTGDPRPSVHLTGVGGNFHAARKRGKKYDLEKERANGLRKGAPMLSSW